MVIVKFETLNLKTMKYVADNIRLIREVVLGVSRKEFAEYIGIISEHQVANYEDGRSIPKTPVIMAISTRCSISPEDLTNKKLTKKDIPVIVIEKNEQDSSRLLEVLQSTIETQQKQISQQQQVIDVLLKKLEEA